VIRNRSQLARTPQHEHALQAIECGIEAAHPQRVLNNTISLEGNILTIAKTEYELDDYDRVLVLGGGKPAGAIAHALETTLGEHLDDGLVVTDTPADTDISGNTETITTYEGNHPKPTAENVRGTEQLLELADDTGSGDLVVVVVSGGASALLAAPVPAVSLSAYRNLTADLLASGASIDDLNAVRKHISRLKGGQLAEKIAPAQTVGVVFSDVVGNPLNVIGSGPTAPDPTSYADALGVLDRYEIDAPDSIAAVLTEGANGDRPETPGEDATAFESVDNHVLADNRTALDAAARACEQAGYEVLVLSTRIEGEARAVGTVHADIALECLAAGDPVDPPAALLSGGETTVTVDGDGRGGPNQEFALAVALELDGSDSIDTSDVVVASVDTDGIDGPTDAAGALVDAETVADDPDSAREALDTNNVSPYLDNHGALIETGPTGTNVNDLRVVLVGTPE
jgi:hydroxypyruvate reductase